MDLLKHAPRFDIEAAAELAEALYGIRATATPLSSERDQNFLLANESGDKFVLKIANAMEDRASLEAQNLAITHLESRLSFCPRVVPTLSGELLSLIESSTGTSNFVRLLTWLPGVPLAEVKQHSPELLRSLGRSLGQLDRALASFDHPAVHRNFHWDLSNGLRIIREYRPLITGDRMRELIQRCARDFERDVASLLPQLRRSVIHGDANDYNVLVSTDEVSQERLTADTRAGRPCHVESQHQSGGDSVVGLIDFGDMVHSFTVGELAVAVAYVVLDKPDPLAAATPIVAGYADEYALTEDEIDALYGLVIMRLCMSICLAAYQQRQQPDNKYLEISQRSITRSLPGLAAIDARAAAAVFRAACRGTKS